MKYLTLFFILLSINLYSQTSNLIVFTEQGERFFLILNGIKQNSSLETNVKVTDLNANSYKVILIFENKQIPNLDKTIYFNEMGHEYTFNVKKNKKGNYVLRLISDVPIANAPVPPANQTVIVYTQTPPAQTTTTTSTTTTNDGISFGMNINDNGVNANLNINTSGNGITTSYTETTTTTTTTTTTNSIQQPVFVPGYTGPVATKQF